MLHYRRCALKTGSAISARCTEARRLKSDKRKRPHSKKEEYIALKGETLHGIFPVSMALEAGHRNFHKIYYCANSPRVEPLLDVAMVKGIEVSPVSFHNLERLCRAFSDKDKKSVHQGVVADVDRLYPLQVEKLELQLDILPPPLWVLLTGIRDPMNLGTILRSAYYLGVDRVLVCPEHPTSSLTATVSKASSGVLEIFPPYSVNSGVERYLGTRVREGWQLLCADVSGGGGREPVLDKPTILIVGAEGAGIPETLKPLCSEFVHLPPGRKLHPEVDSLNVSVATALLIDKIMRTRENNRLD